MSIAAKIRRAPVRLAAGAYTLNSGINKLRADEKTAAGVHGMAANAFPLLKQIPPVAFTKGLADHRDRGRLERCCCRSCPRAWRASRSAGSPPGWSRCTSARRVCTTSTCAPPRRGPGIAKDSWFAAIGYSLVVDAVLSESKMTRTEPVA